MPAWIDEDTGSATLSATRYVAGLDGNLAAAISHTGSSVSARWQLVNLHGDVVTTAADDPALTTPTGPPWTPTSSAPPTAPPPATAGSAPSNAPPTPLGGLILMGVRLYNSTLGRFLQVDPVPGGSANDYDHANQDPINNYDLDGRWWGWRRVFRTAAIVGGVVGALACGASVVCGAVVGAAAAAGAYAASNAWSSRWRWRSFARTTFYGGVSGAFWARGTGRLALDSHVDGSSVERSGDSSSPTMDRTTGSAGSAGATTSS